jgi:hypothetical protein
MDKKLSKKEKYDLKKQKAKKSNGSSSVSTSKIIWGVLVIVVVALIVWSITKPKVERPEAQFLEEGVTELGQSIDIMTVEHIAIRADHEEYNSNPPTSGPHYSDAPGAGVYKNGLKDEEAVHGLEHGNIWISYTSAVDEETFENLRTIQKQNLGSVIMSPREENSALIVLASWGRMLEMQKFDEATINTYIKLHKNQSPEPFAR